MSEFVIDDDFLLSIKPKNKGVSDKYSWNVYKCLSKYKGLQLEVFQFGWCNIYGERDSGRGQVLFRFGGEYVGITGMARNIIRYCDKNVGCCVSWGGLSFSEIDKEEITSKWINRYLRNGRCIINDNVHDFVTINKNSRRCKNCGKIETRKVVTQKIVKRKALWI